VGLLKEPLRHRGVFTKSQSGFSAEFGEGQRLFQQLLCWGYGRFSKIAAHLKKKQPIKKTNKSFSENALEGIFLIVKIEILGKIAL
jgi:hypothetical protein